MFHIIVRDNCQWCDKAKALLDERGLPYETYNIGAGETPFRLFVRHVFETLPQVWEKGNFAWRHIGGYDHLKDYFALTD